MPPWHFTVRCGLCGLPLFSHMHYPCINIGPLFPNVYSPLCMIFPWVLFLVASPRNSTKMLSIYGTHLYREYLFVTENILQEYVPFFRHSLSRNTDLLFNVARLKSEQLSTCYYEYENHFIIRKYVPRENTLWQTYTYTKIEVYLW